LGVSLTTLLSPGRTVRASPRASKPKHWQQQQTFMKRPLARFAVLAVTQFCQHVNALERDATSVSD